MKITPVLLLVAQALAIPFTPRKITSRNYLDKFDNVVVVADPLSPVTNTAGGGLYYFAFNYQNLLTSTVVPPSSPNGITTGPAAMTMTGQPRWYPINSTIACFDQKSIFYGCVTTTEAAVVPISCTIQVAGVSAITGITSVQELLYDNSVAGPLAYATFPALTFSCLSQLSVQVIQSPVSQLLTSPVFDNNNYTVYYK